MDRAQDNAMEKDNTLSPDTALHMFQQYTWLSPDGGVFGPELRCLIEHLSAAWSSLVEEDGDVLLKEVEELAFDFHLKGTEPQWGDIQFGIIEESSNRFEAALWYATLLAALAVSASKEQDLLRATRLSSQSALVLLNVMKPATEEAKNLSLASKGGKGRNKKWDPVREVLANMILQKIPDPNAPDCELFSSKWAAAQYFAPLLQPEVTAREIENQKPSLATTIQRWFSSSNELSDLIEPRVKGKRRRSWE